MARTKTVETELARLAREIFLIPIPTTYTIAEVMEVSQSAAAKKLNEKSGMTDEQAMAVIKTFIDYTAILHLKIKEYEKDHGDIAGVRPDEESEVQPEHG